MSLREAALESRRLERVGAWKKQSAEADARVEYAKLKLELLGVLGVEVKYLGEVKETTPATYRTDLRGAYSRAVVREYFKFSVDDVVLHATVGRASTYGDRVVRDCEFYAEVECPDCGRKHSAVSMDKWETGRAWHNRVQNVDDYAHFVSALGKALAPFKCHACRSGVEETCHACGRSNW